MAGKQFDAIRHRLDDREAFGSMRGTPYYEDAVYPTFSDAEFERRFRRTREKMDRLDLDALVVPGAPAYGNFGGGVTWLTGHREWHSLAVYLLVPLEGDPTLVYSMGGTHAEATRQAVFVDDVRASRGGAFGEVLADRIDELGLESGRVGLVPIDPIAGDHLPAEKHRTLTERLPSASFVRLDDFFHEFLTRKTDEEIGAVARAGDLAARAVETAIDAATPGATEQDVAAAATFAIMDARGDPGYVHVGSTPMVDPALVAANPRPSGRTLARGDLVLVEVSAGVHGFTASAGVPICVGDPTDEVRALFDEAARPGFEAVANAVAPGATVDELRDAAGVVRETGFQSSPHVARGIDLIAGPTRVDVHDASIATPDRTLSPGNVVAVRSAPMTADGQWGLVLEHTLLVTDGGSRRLTDRLPLSLAVADADADAHTNADAEADR